MTGADRVLFVDLDGTLTLDNSFHRFLIALWRHGGPGTRLRILAGFGERVIRRGGHSRVRMKRRALLAYGALSPAAKIATRTAVVGDVTRTLSGPVLDIIQCWRRSGGRVVLATAAPDCYSSDVVDAFEFDDLVATPTLVTKDWTETLGVEKARRCREWLTVNAPAASVGVVTDHVDDAPLLGDAHFGWVQGSQHDVDKLASRVAPGVRIELIDVETAEDDGGIWLWFDDRPSGPHDVWEIRTILSKHRYALMYVGDGRWSRVRPGDDLEAAVKRRHCPRPPATRERLLIMLRRGVVRDRLGVFH